MIRPSNTGGMVWWLHHWQRDSRPSGRAFADFCGTLEGTVARNPVLFAQMINGRSFAFFFMLNLQFRAELTIILLGLI